MNMYSKIIIGLTLLSTYATLPNIVGVACVENKDKNQKIIILYDQHDEHRTNTSVNHQNELKKLITVLSALNKKSSFYIEFPHKTKNFKGTYDHTTIHVPVKDALVNNMQNGSIEYKPFDERTDSDFLVRDMLLHTDQLQQAIDTNYPLPQEFKDITVDSYLQSISNQEIVTQNTAQDLPDDLKSLQLKRNQVYQDAKTIINQVCTNFPVDKKSHFFELAKKISTQNKAQFKLFTSLMDMQSIHSDLTLLKSIIVAHNEISIVLAGAFHANNLEKALMKINYKNVFSDRNLKNGLHVENLQSIMWPQSIPQSFSASIYEFLTLCTGCGKHSSTKCSACKKAYYCSLACQKKEWPTHKVICKK